MTTRRAAGGNGGSGKGLVDVTAVCEGCVLFPRVKGKRREVRRLLATRSNEPLSLYRRGTAVPEACPLQRALGRDLSGQADVPEVSR